MMYRTVYIADSNRISIPIPDRYIGAKLEVLIFPINEVLASNENNKTTEVDISFGGWSEMDKTTEAICSEIRTSRAFRNREIAL